MNCHIHLFFFFQAEDGIRDLIVTGVQTCALPIQAEDGIRDLIVTGVQTCALPITPVTIRSRMPSSACDWSDRKSTRLNSSHDQISYAVFCLKKKTHHPRATGKTKPPSHRHDSTK